MDKLEIKFSSNVDELYDYTNQITLKIDEINALIKKIKDFKIVISFEKPS